jgi:hypothetical protein
MFVQAIERAAAFTRPIHMISRCYGSTAVQPGAATLFFVNSDGWALTCRHVAQLFASASEMQVRFNDFKNQRKELSGNKRKHLHALEAKFSYGPETVIELYFNFISCVQGTLQANAHLHPQLDIALVHFTGYDKLLCTEFPVFAADDSKLQPGKFLFTNFAFDQTEDRIHWTSVGREDSPRFPIEGMVTRHIGDAGRNVVAIEMSTPGLRGQSGGPAFDIEARVWGMQSQTGHLDLDFDVNVEVYRNCQKKRVKDSAFLHVGHCIHVSALKAFMRQHGVSFKEG